MKCAGGEPGESTTINFGVAVSAPVSSRTIGPGNATNTVLVVNDPDAENLELGVNYFQLQLDPDFQFGLFAENVPVTFPADGGDLTLAVYNARYNTNFMSEGDRLQAGYIVNDEPIGGENLHDIGVSTGRPPTSIEFASGPSSLGRGSFATARIRTTARPWTRTGDRHPATLSMQDYKGGALGDLLAESDFVPPNIRRYGDARYAADTGSRVYFQLEGLPTGLTPTLKAYTNEATARFTDRLRMSALQLVEDQGLGGIRPPVDLDPDTWLPMDFISDGVYRGFVEPTWVGTPRALEAGTEWGFTIDIGMRCLDPERISPFTMTIRGGLAPWPVAPPPLLEEGAPAQSIPLPGPAYDPNVGPVENITFDPRDCLPAAPARPQIAADGVVNGASFRPGPVGPGIFTLYSTSVGPAAFTTELPLPTKLGGTTVEINGIRVPLLYAGGDASSGSLGQINLVIPDLPAALGVDLNPGDSPRGELTAEAPNQVEPVTADIVIYRDGVASWITRAPVAAANPGVFTTQFGAGPAIAINPDASLAQPEGAIPGLTTRPALIGDPLIILATGLGPTDPPGAFGDDSFDEDGNFVRRDTVLIPRVLIGGVEAQLLFSGLSAEFPGVYQLNVIPAAGTLAGEAQPLVIEIGGSVSRDDATIAIAAP